MAMSRHLFLSSPFRLYHSHARSFPTPSPSHLSISSKSHGFSTRFSSSSSSVDTSPLLATLSSRSLLHSHTSLPTSSPRGKMSCYFGVDPTSSSLHVGHLPLLFTLCHAHQAGYKPIILVGGATGRIGDPSGKSTERPELPLDVIESNVKQLEKSLFSFWEGYNRWCDQNQKEKEKDLLLVNNEDWYKNQGVLGFLGSVGRNMNVATMLSRESVQCRMGRGEDGEEGAGISLLGFMYQAFQAFDFVELNRLYNCTLQLGGADQWGNIVGGCQLVRKMRGKQNKTEKEDETFVGGITVPLLETASGQKIGKSAGNAVFIDPEITNDYDLYQWFKRAADADVEKFLKIFTLLDEKNIETTIKTHLEQPEKRTAQIALAQEAVAFLRGQEAVKRAEFVSEILFGKHNLKEMSFDQISDALSCFPTATLPLSEVVGVGLPKLLAKVGLSPSISGARRVIKSGGVSLNQETIARDEGSNLTVGEENLIFDGRLVYLQVGKKEKCFVLIEERC